ncbi:MAG: ComEC/Rec2 family competence protein [Proteocatella sp.]
MILIIVIIFAFFYVKIDLKDIENIEDIELKQELSLEVRNIEKNSKNISIYADNIILKIYPDRGFEEVDITQGDIIAFKGNLKPVEYYLKKYQNKSYTCYLKSRDIEYICYPSELNIIGHVKDKYSFRGKITSSLEKYIDELYRTDSSIYKALLYGDKSELTEDVTTLFSHTGTAHILALSGFHVGIILLFINILIGNISVKKRSFLSLVILGVYVFITGSKPSIIRAALFFGAYYLAFLKEKRYNLISCAFISAALMIAINPYYIYDVGFQLSFLSIIAISSLSLILKKYKMPQVLAMTISAQLMTFPIVAFNFGTLPILSSISNIFTIPLISIDMIMFIISLITAPIFTRIPLIKILFRYYIDSVVLIKNLTIYINKVFEKIPFGYVENVSLEIWKIGLYYAIIFIIYKLWQRHAIKENLYEFKALPKIIT